MSTSEHIQKAYEDALDDLSSLLDRNNPSFRIILGEKEARIPLSIGWRPASGISSSAVVQPVKYGDLLLFLVWYHPEEELIEPHAHPFSETFEVIEGDLHLFVGDEEPIHLTVDDPPFRVDSRQVHQYKVTPGTTVITTYPRHVVAEETLKPEKSGSPVVPVTDPRNDKDNG